MPANLGRCHFMLFGLLLLIAPLAQKATTPPDLINYQGVLRRANGEPYTGNVEMTLRLFTADVGGSEILSDQHCSPNSVHVQNGLFTVLIGGGILSDGSGVFDNDPYDSVGKAFQDFSEVWLQVELGASPPEVLQPRVRITSTAYALKPPKQKKWVLRDVRPPDEDGGNPLEPDLRIWHQRVLNTVVQSDGPEVTLSDNRITIRPGSYHIWARAPIFNSEQHRSRVWDETHSAVAAWGSNGWGAGGIESIIDDTIVVSSTSVFMIQTGSTGWQWNWDGPQTFGIHDSLGPEIYTQVTITKLE